MKSLDNFLGGSNRVPPTDVFFPVTMKEKEREGGKEVWFYTLFTQCGLRSSPLPFLITDVQ